MNGLRSVGVVGAIVGALAVGSACSFEKSLPGASSGGPDAGDVEGGEQGMGVAACKTPDATGLVVCLEFEDTVSDGTFDDSSPARRNAQSTGMAVVPRDGTMVGSMAADVGPAAATYVAQDAALDLASGYTLAAWVKPDTVPAASEARGVLDHEGQYAMIVSATPSGAINNRCQHTGVAKYEYTERLPVNTWSFMACTWDGTQLCAWRWASATDHERFCHTPTVGPAESGAQGLAIGHLSTAGASHHQFDGALDSVQVYSRGLSEAQLCALAGQAPGCMPCDAGCI